ncbi:SDR family oxidoreductase [Nocardioides sp.]|uniref:SDR family oxidoreductase n=1 Tax=Nocardioides sp. TaxID=35761 RepID=UPI003D0FBBC4
MDVHGLAGLTAIITGGSRGIGLATADAFAAAGSNVVLTSRRLDSALNAADSINARAEPGRGVVVGMEAHATTPGAAELCVQRTLEEFGSVDILVNNAGTNPAYGPLIEQDHLRFAKTFDVNVWAAVNWTSVVVRAWMGEHGGSVVNTASIGGLSVEPDVGVYNATKAALIHLTRQQAFELAPGVRVNAVAPGVVRTRLAELLWSDHEERLRSEIPLGRIGEPEDIAGLVTFLASRAASWITGQTVVIDGGALLGDASADRAPRASTAEHRG